MKITATSYLLSKQRAKNKADRQKAETQYKRHQLELEVAKDPEDAEYRIKDLYWAERIGSEFVRKYPGHGWEVLVDSRNGIATVFNKHLSGKIGWLMHLKDINIPSLPRDVMRIGGEMLRRFGVNSDTLVEREIMEVKRSFNGNVKVDLS